MPRLERRQALIEATIPLLSTHGAAVSTRQVAEAAGVAEGTIFRAFSSLEDLIRAATLAAIQRDHIAQQLDAIGASQPDLAGTIRELVRQIGDHVRRTRPLIELAHELHIRPECSTLSPDAAASDPDLRDGAAPEAAASQSGRAAPSPGRFHAAITDAVIHSLSRHADELTVSPALAASALISLTFGALHPIAGHPELDDPTALTDLLLHGIAKDA